MGESSVPQVVGYLAPGLRPEGVSPTPRPPEVYGHIVPGRARRMVLVCVPGTPEPGRDLLGIVADILSHIPVCSAEGSHLISCKLPQVEIVAHSHRRI